MCVLVQDSMAKCHRRDKKSMGWDGDWGSCSQTPSQFLSAVSPSTIHTYHFSQSNPALGGWQAFKSHHPEGYPFVAVQLRILQQQRNTFLKISFIWTH